MTYETVRLRLPGSSLSLASEHQESALSVPSGKRSQVSNRKHFMKAFLINCLKDLWRRNLNLLGAMRRSLVSYSPGVEKNQILLSDSTTTADHLRNSVGMIQSTVKVECIALVSY